MGKKQFIDKKNSISFKLIPGEDGKSVQWVPMKKGRTQQAKELFNEFKQTLGSSISLNEREKKTMSGLERLMDIQRKGGITEEDDDIYFDEEEEEFERDETEEEKKERLHRTCNGYFPDDGYDYSKHIRGLSGKNFMSAFSEDVLQPPKELFESNDKEDVEFEEFEEDEEEEEEEKVVKKKEIQSNELEEEEPIELNNEELPAPFLLKPDFKAYGVEKYGKIDEEISRVIEEEDAKEVDEEEYGEDYDEFFDNIVQEFVMERAEEEVNEEEEEEELTKEKYNKHVDFIESMFGDKKKSKPIDEEVLDIIDEDEEWEEEEEEEIPKKPIKKSVAFNNNKPVPKQQVPSKKQQIVIEEEDDDDDWEEEEEEVKPQPKKSILKTNNNNFLPKDIKKNIKFSEEEILKIIEDDEDGDWEDEDDEEIEEVDPKEAKKAFDEKFETLFKTAYSDDQIGELDDNDPRFKNRKKIDIHQMNDLLEEFFTHQRKQFGAGEFKKSNEITDEELQKIQAELPEGVVVFRKDDLDKQYELTPEERVKRSFAILEKLEKEEENGETEVIAIKEKDSRWDCETILSTYSSIYNHPSVIDDSLGKKKKQIKLSTKTGMPLGVLDNKNMTEEEVTEEDFEDVVNMGQARKKTETKEEKKERKQKMKEMKKQKREQKKTIKDSFKQEERNQQKIFAEPMSRQKVVVKY
ncbi:hypothetical protein ABK040_012904 [Willaertia magna]